MTARNGVKLSLLAVLLGTTGCRSRQEMTNAAAIEQAKLMAAQTNGAMKVVTVEADGSRLLTLVQPPNRSSKTPQLSTRILPKDFVPEFDGSPVLPVITPADAPDRPDAAPPAPKPGPA